MQNNSSDDKLVKQLKLLTEIGLALSVEENPKKLLEMILETSETLTNADAGTVYRVDLQNKLLHFEILNNKTFGVQEGGMNEGTVKLPPIPLYVDGNPNYTNASSWVALKGEVIRIKDVHSATEFDFTGSKNYDKTTGYKSKSMLIFPIKDHHDKIVAVVQLINAKDEATGEVIEFSEDYLDIVTSLAAQAGVALTNTELVLELSNEINNVKVLQEKEKDLNLKLRDAFMEVENSNKSLRVTVTRMKAIRALSVALIVIVFPLFGVAAWNKDMLMNKLQALETIQRAQENVSQSTTTVSVYRGPVSKSLSLSGRLEPLREINVVSPIGGKVKGIHFKYGQFVRKGELLLELEAAEIERGSRVALSEYIRAKERHENLLHWLESVEVKKAKLSFARAKKSLESSKRKMEETQRLLRKGIIPATENESAEESYSNELLNYNAVVEELNTTIGRGNAQNVKIAQLDLQNKEQQLNIYQKQIKQSKIYASESGIVIIPTKEKKYVRMSRGLQVSQGGILFAIGNMKGIRVIAPVDEVDIHKLMVKQDVEVSGDAFSNQVLFGYISHISQQASKESRDVPLFEIEITVDFLTRQQKKLLRIGMSSFLNVIVYDIPDALLVSLDAVEASLAGSLVRVKDKKDGLFNVRKITTGLTTFNSVEILDGLKEGEEVALLNPRESLYEDYLKQSHK